MSTFGKLEGIAVIKSKDGKVKKELKLTSDPIPEEEAKKILNKTGVTDHGDHAPNSSS